MKKLLQLLKSLEQKIPFIRPKVLSDDYTGTGDVLNHALKFMEEKGYKYEYLCTIYATAPLLQAKYLIEGFEKLKKSDAINAFSCTSMPFPIFRTFKITEKGRCEMFFPEYYYTRSQDLEEAYQDAGQFYWKNLERAKNINIEIMFSNYTIPIILPRHLVQDIDTEEDWQRAEYMYDILRRK